MLCTMNSEELTCNLHLAYYSHSLYTAVKPCSFGLFVQLDLSLGKSHKLSPKTGLDHPTNNNNLLRFPSTVGDSGGSSKSRD